MCYKKILLALSLLISVITHADRLNANAIKIGFVSGRGLENTVRQWTPLMTYLTREVGVPFEMALREDYEALWESLEKGEIDLYEGGSFSNLRVAETGRVKADVLVGQVILGQKTYRGAFIVRAKDNLQGFADLKNKRLAFKNEISTTGYLVPRVMLARAGIDDPSRYFSEVVFTASHYRSFTALLESSIDVAAVSDLFLGFLPAEKRAKVKVIQFSDPLTLGPISIRENFNPELRTAITNAFLAYDKKVPENMKRIMEVDKFVIQERGAYDIVGEYADEFDRLPKMSGMVPVYRRVPAFFSEKIAAEKRMALFWMIGSFAVLAAALAVTAVKFRRGCASSIGLVVTVMVALFAAFFTVVQIVWLFSMMNSFSVEKLSRLENTNLRVASMVEGGRAGELGDVLSGAASDGMVAWVKLFREGFIVASSDEKEIGTSIIDQIRAGTFDRLPGGGGKDIVQVEDPVMANGRAYGMLQFGISFEPVSVMARRSIIVNMLAMAAALAAGFLTAVFAKRRLARPIHVINEAIEKMREGERVRIEGTCPDVKQVEASISRLGRELAEKQELEDLKNCELDCKKNAWDPEVTRELEVKICDMEAENGLFRKIRMTEAIGNSPAWLRVLRDVAIRSRDRDPVVIYGPTGAGKTGIARVIHSLSPRHGNKFGEFNCAEFASGDPLVVLGKLFGYGADSGISGIDRLGQKGILEEFDGGTIFFDEAEILPQQAQQLLLLPLEGRPFNTAAGKRAQQVVNIRFIFATNEPLEVLSRAGNMRKDLLRRILARGVVRVPTLAERSEDIELLALRFLSVRNANLDKKISLSYEAVELLKKSGFERYNVSELKGMIDHAFERAVFDEDAKIMPRHLDNAVLENAEACGVKNAEEWLPGLHDDEEKHELAALRKFDFKIVPAAKHLGYVQGSKTLTNRFRGLVYRTLEHSQWSKKTAIMQILGVNSGYAVVKRVKAKIDDYTATAKRNLEGGNTSKIFNNLPKKYHMSAERFLDAVRDDKIKDFEITCILSTSKKVVNV